MKNKLLLITGHRKSGTTLLASLFDKNSDFLLYPPDLTLMYTFYPNYIDKKITLEQKKKILKKIILDSFTIRFKQTGHKEKVNLLVNSIIKKINSKNVKNIFKILKILINEYSKITKKKFKYFVIKETSQLINFDLFLKNFKDIKIINITRNPFDNFSSLKSGMKYYKNNGEDYLTLFLSFIFRCTLDLKIAHKLKKKHPDILINIKYEDLVSDKKKVLNKINKFLECNIDTKEFTPSYFGKNFNGNSFIVNKFKGVSNTRTNIFKHNLNPSEISLISFFFEEMLIKQKYKIPTNNMDNLKDLYYSLNKKFFYKKKEL